MLKGIKKFVNATIIEPVKKNLTASMFYGGLGLIILGVILPLTKIAFLITSGDIFLKIGSAILGAGVFAVIMKSSQFTTIFQEHVFDVFYKPNEIGDNVSVIDKWKILTENLLKYNLPASYKEATNKIEKIFFNSELDYHFDNHSIKYKIEIDANMIATVTSTTDTTIVLADNKENPILHQKVTTNNKVELLSLFLNAKSVAMDLTIDEKNEHIHHLNVNLNEYKMEPNCQTIRMERTLRWEQDLKVDPWINGVISRYVKGFDVKAKVSDGYKVLFDNFSSEDMPDNSYHADDGSGYQRWQLAETGNLLLPGQGYVLVVIKI